jgi:hypothetical protein
MSYRHSAVHELFDISTSLSDNHIPPRSPLLARQLRASALSFRIASILFELSSQDYPNHSASETVELQLVGQTSFAHDNVAKLAAGHRLERICCAQLASPHHGQANSTPRDQGQMAATKFHRPGKAESGAANGNHSYNDFDHDNCSRAPDVCSIHSPSSTRLGRLLHLCINSTQLFSPKRLFAHNSRLQLSDFVSRSM